MVCCRTIAADIPPANTLVFIPDASICPTPLTMDLERLEALLLRYNTLISELEHEREELKTEIEAKRRSLPQQDSRPTMVSNKKRKAKLGVS